MGDSRGSIAFFGTYRPPVPLDIYSCRADPPPSSAEEDEVLLTDGVSYNHNARAIPAAALKELLTFLHKKNPELATDCGATPDDADTGRVTGLVFVSERDGGLETLHVALRFNDDKKTVTKVLRLAEIYGADTFGGVRMEDSGCIAGGFKVGARTVVGYSLVYVSTKEEVKSRRTPWTVVYRTNLADGKTERLTPQGQYDLSPSVSPSGKRVAVANFVANRWNGEIEKLRTNIVVMNVDKKAQRGLGREIVIEDGGWPTWGSDNVIFFHRGVVDPPAAGMVQTTRWGVFRYDLTTKKILPVTPAGIDAMTPAAISETKVAVATIRQKSEQNAKIVKRVEKQYRHIEIFDVSAAAPDPHPVKITQNTRPKGDHYNPFLVVHGGEELQVGYHRCHTDESSKLHAADGTLLARKFDKLQSPHPNVGLLRGSGVFPTVSEDGSRIAFVDNEFKAVWVADAKGLRRVYKPRGVSNLVFSTAWSKKRESEEDAARKGFLYDTLLVCIGPSFSTDQKVNICAISDLDAAHPTEKRLTDAGDSNNAFPSTNPDGTKLVFRSRRDGVMGMNKNLFIMDAVNGESRKVPADRLTEGDWIDTHCSWSPTGDWIVFSSTRGKPETATGLLDAGHYAVYLVKANDRTVWRRVVQSSATLAGHVNHPMFSPDMRSVVFASDLAAVSADPISMPIFIHSVRPYGDIFSVELRDTEDLTKNEDITKFHRITHSRYEYSTPTWTAKLSAEHDPNKLWNLVPDERVPFKPACPYMHGKTEEGWHMTGHLTIQKRCC